MAGNNQESGEINMSDDILKLLSDLWMNAEHSDVTFIVENIKIPAHKVILLARSPYFVSLLNGGFAEATQSEIKLEVPLDAFKEVLRFIYTGQLSLAGLEMNQIVDLYSLADQYGFESLKKTVSKYLVANISMNNCYTMFDAAALYSMRTLQDACLAFMDQNSMKLLNDETFKTTSFDLLCSLLKRVTFYAPEIEIFKAVENWSAHNKDINIKEAMRQIRWNLMSVDDLMKIVYPSNILEVADLMRVIKEQNDSNINENRIQCIDVEEGLEENIATEQFNAKTISGENPEFLLNGNFTNYDLNDCTYHPIISYEDYSEEHWIIVKLGDTSIINHIQILLMDKDDRSYSYYIDVSVDGVKYTRLIDNMTFFCRSWQKLHFHSRPVRYIKLEGTRVSFTGKVVYRMGTYGLKCMSFDVVGLKAMFKSKCPELVNGFISPTFNVAKLGNVIDGGGKNNMLNENLNEFTCHEEDSSILLLLNQPTNIGSIRLLLGTEKNHSNQYSFYIETSLNKETWETAVDKRNENLSDWQEFQFTARPTSFIRITGTKPDVFFICTYFECPCNPERPTMKGNSIKRPEL